MDKLKFIQVNVFADSAHSFGNQDIRQQTRQMKVLFPVDAIAYLTLAEDNNPRKGYHIHIKKSYKSEIDFPVKSINTLFLSHEQVELLGQQ